MKDFSKGLAGGLAAVVAWAALTWLVANLGLSGIFGVIVLGPLALGAAVVVALVKGRRALAGGLGTALALACAVLAAWIWLFWQILKVD